MVLTEQLLDSIPTHGWNCGLDVHTQCVQCVYPDAEKASGTKQILESRR